MFHSRCGVYLLILTGFLVINIVACVLIGIQIFRHASITLNDPVLPFYAALFLGGNFLSIGAIKAFAHISQQEMDSASDNNLPGQIQGAVSLLKAELTEILMTRKELNKINNAISHCTHEIERFEKELFSKVMGNLADLNLEANQRIVELAEQKRTLEGQVVELMMSAERWEHLLRQDDPNLKIQPTKLIDDAEKLITGLKIIYPKSGDAFIAENHEAPNIPPGTEPFKIGLCKARGFIFNNKVLKKAEIELKMPAQQVIHE